ncbi:hypothetical protein ABZX64_33415, partial [Streptomyces misionensis]|uniref:hypothetical protein n=1 Tax=Streptomyces misionensis TaxID=67331 RepID=UPI0033A2D765
RLDLGLDARPIGVHLQEHVTDAQSRALTVGDELRAVVALPLCGSLTVGCADCTTWPLRGQVDGPGAALPDLRVRCAPPPRRSFRLRLQDFRAR